MSSRGEAVDEHVHVAPFVWHFVATATWATLCAFATVAAARQFLARALCWSARYSWVSADTSLVAPAERAWRVAGRFAALEAIDGVLEAAAASTASTA